MHLCRYKKEDGRGWSGERASFLLEGTTNRQTMVIQSRVFGRHFLKSEVSLLLQGKYLIVFVANDKNGSFKQKFQFWKTCSCHYTAPPNLKIFLMTLVLI